MVTLQAKQQQQREPSRRQNSHEQRAVEDDDGWNDRRSFDRRSAAIIGERYETRKIDDDWTIAGLPVDRSETNDKLSSRTEEKSSALSLPLTCRGRVNGEADGSNGESTQCSDFEDDDDGEKNLGLAEEEEENNDDNDDDDDDDDDDGEDSESERSDRWIRRKVVTTRVQHDDNSNGGDGQAVVLPNLDDTTFGQVCITNSSNVHVGNTNFYKGPVTIKQFVYTNAYPVQDKEDGSLEANCSGRISDINPNDVPVVKGDPNGPILPSYRDYDTVTKWLWTWRCAAILCVLALILVTVVAVVSVLLSRNNETPKKTIQESPTSGANENDTLVNGVRFIERDMWGAQPPTEPPEKLAEVPVPYVIISHTVTQPCVAQSECVLRVRVAQTLHIESFKWDDIGYNFLIGGDGNAYVGRGWDAKGSHAFGWNQKSMGISFIGTFNDVAPPPKQLNAAIKCIEFGVKIGKISPTFKVLGHRQVSETLSPGDELYKILQTWDHWSPTPRPSTPTQGAASKSPHPAIALPLALLILPQLILLLRRFSNFLIEALLEFGNRRFSLSFSRSRNDRLMK